MSPCLHVVFHVVVGHTASPSWGLGVRTNDACRAAIWLKRGEGDCFFPPTSLFDWRALLVSLSEILTCASKSVPFGTMACRINVCLNFRDHGMLLQSQSQFGTMTCCINTCLSSGTMTCCSKVSLSRDHDLLHRCLTQFWDDEMLLQSQSF